MFPHPTASARDMLAFKFVAEALGVEEPQGKSAWDAAKQRLKRRGLELPETTLVKAPEKRKATPQLKADDAARALRLVLTEPAKFFGDAKKLAWLRAKVSEARGDPATVDKEAAALEAERQQRDEDAKSLALPGVMGLSGATIRIARDSGEVLGSIYDYLKWLGLMDPVAEWNHWLADEFGEWLRSHEDFHDCEAIRFAQIQRPGQGQCDELRSLLDSKDFEVIRIVMIQVSGQGQRETPFTNFAGFRLLAKLCLGKSKIAQALFDEAQTVLGRVAVGDQRLHETIDANAAASAEPAREFVLGAREAARQAHARLKAFDADAFERATLEDRSIGPEEAQLRLTKLELFRSYQETTTKTKALVKRRRYCDLQVLEQEALAKQARLEEETRAAVEAANAEQEKHKIEQERYKAEQRKIQEQAAAELQAIREEGKAAAEERERQRAHARELAAERRKREIQQAAEKGEIAAEAAEALLGAGRLTPILRFERWIGDCLRCPRPSVCSSRLGRLFNAAVARGEHTKPAAHWDSDRNTWKLYEEHDGRTLRELHDGLHAPPAGQTTLRSALRHAAVAA